MVGVPGRSKGCNTCKKRKIACGLEKPQCAQCIRSQRLCTGYQRERVFIVTNGESDYTARSNLKLRRETVTSSAGSTTVSLKERRKFKHKQNHASRSYLAEQRFPFLTTDGATVPLAWNSVTTKSTESDSIPSTMCLVPAYRDQLLATYISHHIPIDQLGPTDRLTWMHELFNYPTKTAALTSAILCVSTASLAKHHANKVLTRQSREIYTDSLWHLQKALWDPDQMYSEATLAACVMLCMYELFECPGGNRCGYISHANGCARLLQLRGPEMHAEGFAHTTFLVMRTQLIFQALERHEETFLTEEKWMEAPWEGKVKNASDRLFDYVAYSGGIFGRADRFGKMERVEVLDTVLKIVNICWEQHKGLMELYHEMQDRVPGPLFWPRLSEMVNPEDDAVDGKVFPVAYEFFNLEMAITLMLYWSTLTMLSSGLVLLYGVLQHVRASRREVLEIKDPHPLLLEAVPVCTTDCACEGIDCQKLLDMSKLRPLGSDADFLTPARHLCQSIEYCLQPKMLGLGRTSIIAPLIIVLDTIEPFDFCKREVRWGKHVLSELEPHLPYLEYVRLWKESKSSH